MCFGALTFAVRSSGRAEKTTTNKKLGDCFTSQWSCLGLGGRAGGCGAVFLGFVVGGCLGALALPRTSVEPGFSALDLPVWGPLLEFLVLWSMCCTSWATEVVS